MRHGLESKKSLNATEQSHYRLLVSSAWIGARPELLPQALSFFKDNGQFYKYRLYKQSSRVLNAFYTLLSAVHFPTLLSPSEYPTAQALNSMSRVLAHRHNDINPYVNTTRASLSRKLPAKGQELSAYQWSLLRSRFRRLSLET